MKTKKALESELIHLAFLMTVLLGAALLSACMEGPRGHRGNDGKDCSIEKVVGGSLIKCGKSTSAVILDGQDGVDGEDAATVISVSEIIDPCGKQTSFDEVILRLTNGQLLAHYSQGGNEFLSVIGPGSYRTTDGTNCNFTVNSTGSVTW